MRGGKKETSTNPRPQGRGHTPAGFLVDDLWSTFWDIGSDTYLNMRGWPWWACKALRYSMFFPKLIIEPLGLGGVVKIVARSPDEANEHA